MGRLLVSFGVALVCGIDLRYLCICADKDKDKAAKANEPRAGADVGKIVNLMSVDCNRVSHSIIYLPSPVVLKVQLICRSRWYLLH